MSDFNEKNSKKYEYIDNVYEQIMELQSCGIIAYKLPNREVIVYNDAAKKMRRRLIERIQLGLVI